jgi:hypothetical protein
MVDAIDRLGTHEHAPFTNASNTSWLSAVHTTRSAQSMADVVSHSNSLVQGANKTWSRAATRTNIKQLLLDVALTARPCVDGGNLARLQVAYHASPTGNVPFALSFSMLYNTSLLDLVGFTYMDGMSHAEVQQVCPLFNVEESSPGQVSLVCSSLTGEHGIPPSIDNVLSLWVQAKAEASGTATFAIVCNDDTLAGNWECTRPAPMEIACGGCAAADTPL